MIGVIDLNKDMIYYDACQAFIDIFDERMLFGDERAGEQKLSF